MEFEAVGDAVCVKGAGRLVGGGAGQEPEQRDDGVAVRDPSGIELA